METCPGGDGAAVGERKDGASEGVFEADDPGGAGMDVGACDGVFSDVSEGEMVIVCWEDGSDEGAREGSNATCFPGGLDKGSVSAVLMDEGEIQNI